jgi:hypothetical protein
VAAQLAASQEWLNSVQLISDEILIISEEMQ